MTDILIENYSTKFFLEKELSLANRLSSLSLMPVILLLTIHLIAYQQLHDKELCFFNFIVATFTYVNTALSDKI